jgi:hypothetical protein
MILASIRGACRRFAVMASLLAMALCGHAQEEGAGHKRTQEITLKTGWNAVYLEVQPIDPSPAKVFSGLPVDKVATLFESPATNQFVTNPGVDLFEGRGWGVWYAPSQPEAFLKSLDAIDGNRGYLVHATKDCQWRAAGQVKGGALKWQPDAFNFVGFSMASSGGPTFAQFFAGSKAHRGQKIYRLVDGRWKLVAASGAEAMRGGEAFWIYCNGSSDYQGPLRVETALSQGLQLGRGSAKVILRNDCPHPLASTVEHVVGDGPPVPLSILVRAYGNPSAPVTPVAANMPSGAWSQALPSLEIGAALAIPMECRNGEMTRARQGSLLKITSDLGSETWVPVTGYRSDLED